MMRNAKIMTVFFVAVAGLLALCSSAQAVEGMVSYWKFDEGIGITAYDCWGDNHGTLVNDPIWATGEVNNALYFERGKYVEIPDSDDLDFTTSLSIEAWVKANLNKSLNTPLSIIDGEHHAKGKGKVIGIDAQEPVFLKPGTKATAEGEGSITATRIAYKNEEGK